MIPPTYFTNAGDRVPTEHISLRGQSGTSTSADHSTVLIDVPRETHLMLLSLTVRVAITAGATAVRVNRIRGSIVTGNERAWLFDYQDEVNGVGLLTPFSVAASSSAALGLSPNVLQTLVPGGSRLQVFTNLSVAPASQQIFWSLTAYRFPAGNIQPS